MKIFKSIKWRLQIWYGLILVAVLAGLASLLINWNTANQLENARQLRRMDEQLILRFDF